MTFKNEIEDLRLAVLVKRFPNNNLDWINKHWYNVSVKFTKGRSAPGVEKNIVEYLKLKGHQAEKISVTGRMIDNSKKVVDVLGRNRVVGSKKWIKSTSTKGSADISATVYGMAVKIEVKFGKDRMSPDQKKYQQAIQKAGGFYMIAHDEEDFLIKFNELQEHPTIKLLKTMC